MFLKIPLERLSLLCHNVATCLSAGLGVPASLRASVRSSSAGPLRGIVEAAAESTASGTELSEALEPNRDRFPRFFVPVIRCGEQSGRLDEAFRYLAQHCHLMARPSSLARNIWLLPLAILVGFSLVGLVITAVVAPIWVALAHAGQELGRYAVLAAVVAVVLFVPEVRAVVDRVKLAIPVVGAIERDLAVNRFFHALHLVYATGGMRVEAMIRLAAESVDNRVIRDDFLSAVGAVEAGATLSEALQPGKFILEEYKTTVRIGEESGKLEHAFEVVCRVSQQALEHRVRTFNEYVKSAVKVAVLLSMLTGVGSQLAILWPAIPVR